MSEEFDEGTGVDRVRFEHLVQEAERLGSNLLRMQTSQPSEKNDCVKNLIEAIYSLHLTIFHHEQIYASFLQDRHVKRSKSENPYHSTVRAVMERLGSRKVRSLCTHYAQACLVLERENVSIGTVAQWLNEPLRTERGGRGLTGIGKTKHLWSLTPEGQAQREGKQADKRERAEKYVANTIESCDGQIDEHHIAADETQVVEGANGIALVEFSDGAVNVLNLLTTDSLKAAEAIRVCISRSPGTSGIRAS